MTLSDISIRNPVFAWMLMSALILFGLIGYGRMGVSQLPDVDFPVVSVTLTWEGAAPQVMESDIVDPVEDAVMGIQGIRDVSSSIRQGNATVTIEFELDRDIDVAVQEVQTKIAQAQRLLPREMDPPIVTKVNPEDQPVVWLAVTGDRPLRDLMRYVQDYLKNQFTTLEGAGEVMLGGYVDPNLRIWVDGNKLIANQLTALDIITAVQQQHEEVPAGRIETPEIERNVRVMGEAPSPKDLENIVIERRAGGPVYRPIRLGQVAAAEDGLADVRRTSHFGGKPAVGLGIRKQRGSNEVALAHRVLKRLGEIRDQIPEGINVFVAFNRTQFIEDSIRELTFTLILSAVATSLVCWLFLGSWTATLNILLAIPTSILGTFTVIYFMGFTLNTFTVLGLSLAVGIVVDDAIMVLENIVRYREQGEEKVAAARHGARQITFAALASTLALIAIFLPVAFMSGIVGKFFFQYGVTISVAVALSLLEALTLTPMRCARFLEVGPRSTRIGRWIDRSFRSLAAYYGRSLGWALARRWRVVAAAGLFFVATLLILMPLRKEFLPSQDQSMLLARIQTPVGSSLEYTDNRFKEIERFVMSRPEVDHYFAAIGGFTGGDINSGFLFVTLKKPKDRPVVPPAKHRLSQGELMNYFRAHLSKMPGIQKAIIQDPSQGGFSAQRGFPIEFAVQGPDWERLTGVAEEILARIKRGGLMVDVDSDYQEKVPEVRISPDRARSSARGVSVDAIGQTINAMIGGEPIAKYTEGGRRYDVRIRLDPGQRQSPDDINRLQVWNNRGELVWLRDVVAVRETPASLTLTRRNRQRAVSIFANVAPGKSQTDAIKEVNRVAKTVLPPGYTVTFTGSSRTFKESFQSLLFVLLLGIIVSYMVLGSQFNSYLDPVVVLMALPFSMSGALIGLWAAGQSINIYSLIGIILLMGIVKKNSILLVDFANQYRAQGYPVRESLMKACPLRLRPILMTSLATIAAAIPPALALGPGAETRVPMAIAVIGGVLFSTFLTLLVIPSAYLIFSGLERRTYPQPGRREGGEHPRRFNT